MSEIPLVTKAIQAWHTCPIEIREKPLTDDQVLEFVARANGMSREQVDRCAEDQAQGKNVTLDDYR